VVSTLGKAGEITIIEEQFDYFSGVQMDPSFLFAVTNALRERQMADAAGKQAAFELQKQQEAESLLNKRKEVLESMKQESNRLLARSHDFPAEVVLHSALIAQYMVISGIVPDSFTEEKDKEQSILLHKKLVNLTNKCLPFISAEEKAQIDACLTANWRSAYLEFIYPKIVAREQLELVNKKLRGEKRRSIIAWVLFCYWAAFGSYVGVILGMTSIKLEDPNLVSLASIGIAIGIIAIFLPVFYWIYPKEMVKTRKTKEQLLMQANLTDKNLWQGVQKEYPVFPTAEQLRAEYDQLRQTVRSTEQKYSPPGEEPPES
jgi:hypothetical protein